jgi:prepilin-type N-terminal cleavage/methylation domain-containing protein
MTEDRRQKAGFTMVEILTVMAVMAILIGVLLPALSTARNAARTAKQRVQFISIEQALLAFRNDNGDYPPSSLDSTSGFDYLGAHKLAEALLGWDLLGFHPKSVWRADGKDSLGTTLYDSSSNINLSQRKPRYLELETANAFHTGKVTGSFDGLFSNSNCGSMYPYNYVLCDVFGWTKVDIGNKRFSAGMPILYYKANTSGIGLVRDQRQEAVSIYRYSDNKELVTISPNKWYFDNDNPPVVGFRNFITDPKVSGTALPWPHRPDSYILISAGIDGLYGTADDITNFGY